LPLKSTFRVKRLAAATARRLRAEIGLAVAVLCNLEQFGTQLAK
jgi:hypothetical protein